MIYTKKTKKAMKIMYKKHRNQVDRSDLPYIFHPWHVAENQPDETRTIVALLHDVVEDTDMTFEDLEKEGFSEEVIEALKLLTHTSDMDYFEYVERISNNPIALDVKLADLKHNSEIERLDNITDKDIARKEKYEKCIEYLELKKSILDDIKQLKKMKSTG